MYLQNLELINFRSFSDATVPFCRDITVLVGENNGGKSNVIDALRLLTAPLVGRRELYCEQTDIRFGSSCRRFELQSTLSSLSAAQQGRLLSAAADSSLESAVYGLIYEAHDGEYPTRPTLWAGQLKGTPEPGSLEMVRHVYLPPLRDARRALSSGNPTRVYSLLRHFLGDQQPDDLARRLARDESVEILTRIDRAVDVGLSELTGGVRQQNASLGFSTDEKLIDIARDLRFKLADYGIKPEDLRYSGHGYANLLYIATLAVALERADTADLTLFLVEEPEAHLHPQLQAAVLSFLQDQATKSNSSDPVAFGPAGDVQVVVATHSPNLSAWVESRKLVVFRSLVELPPVEEVAKGEVPSTSGGAIDHGPNETPATGEADVGEAPERATGDSVTAEESAAARADAKTLPRRRITRCVPLAKLELRDTDRRKIDRYLDVTKSALLFGGRVLLVEGIAEALLLPVIARTSVLKDKPDELRVFRAAVFVPIDGVDFGPYVRLLLTPHSEVRIADKVVVMTDGDAADVSERDTLPGKRRKDELEAVAAAVGATDTLDTVVSTFSLEAELANAGNADLMKRVYLELHPRSEEKWDAAVRKSGHAMAIAIQDLFKTVRKGDFAQVLAERIDEGNRFTTPDYMKAAIEALVR